MSKESRAAAEKQLKLKLIQGLVPNYEGWIVGKPTSKWTYFVVRDTKRLLLGFKEDLTSIEGTAELKEKIESLINALETRYIDEQQERIKYIERYLTSHTGKNLINAASNLTLAAYILDMEGDKSKNQALKNGSRTLLDTFVEKIKASGGNTGEKVRRRLATEPIPQLLKELETYSGNRDKLLNPVIDQMYMVLRNRKSGQGGGGHKRKSTRKNIPVRGFAVVQSTEKPWVKEPNYRRWVAKLRRHTAKVKKHGEVEHPDNMCVDSEICKGDLGIPRRLMPQFTSPKDIQSFTRFAEKKYGIKSKRSTRKAGQLRPSQEEINRERVEDVADDIRHKKLDPKVPLIVSSDNFVIDGHHRWAAYRVDHPTTQMPVLVVDAPARDVLSVAATWGAKHHQF
jgi:hypothetical protein